MANKFTQSVLQRLEQEQKIQPKSKPQTKTASKSTEEPKAKEADLQVNAKENNSAENDVVQNIPDISDYIRLEPGRTAKNKTFYLDVEVIGALCAAARRQNVTDSKLCNDILRRVLGVGTSR